MLLALSSESECKISPVMIPGPAALSWITEKQVIGGAREMSVCAIFIIGLEERGGS